MPGQLNADWTGLVGLSHRKRLCEGLGQGRSSMRLKWLMVGRTGTTGEPGRTISHTVPIEDRSAAESTFWPELLVEQAPDAIIFADREGVIRLWNRAAEELFGFSREQAVGQTLDIIVPDLFREGHWRGFRSAIAVGATHYGTKPRPACALKASGEEIYVELSFSVIRQGETVLGVSAHAHDITRQFERERWNRSYEQTLGLN